MKLKVLLLVALLSAPAPATAVEAYGPACDVLAAAGTPCGTYYTDSDGDGYGDPATAHRRPVPPSGRTGTGGDCDDADPAVHPGAVEVYDGRDDDCDGTADEVVLVISELMVNPRAVSDTAGEYAEVANASDEPVRLTGVVLTVGTRACEMQGTLGAGGRFVVARSSDPSVNGGFTPDLVCPISLANTGAAVSLDAATATLDTLSTAGLTVPDGAALSLAPEAHDPAANDGPSAWCAATSPLPSGDRGTPGSANDPCS